MNLDELTSILEAEAVILPADREAPVQGVYACDLMSDVLAFISPGALLLTGLTNCHVIRTLEMAEISCVCFVRGKRPPEDALELARQKHIAIFTTYLSMYEACGRLHAKGVPGSPVQT